MDFFAEFMKAVVWLSVRLGMVIGIGFSKVFFGTIIVVGGRHGRRAGKLAKTHTAEQDENRRMADVRTVVLQYAQLQGHIARECMNRDELEEKIDNGITADELRAELNDRINQMPGIVLGVNQHIP